MTGLYPCTAYISSLQISYALQRNPHIVNLNLIVYSPFRLVLEELRTIFDVVVQEYNRASIIVGRAQRIRVAPTTSSREEWSSVWSSVLYTCSDSVTHSHISHYDGQKVTIDVFDHRPEGDIVKRGAIQEDLPF